MKKILTSLIAVMFVLLVVSSAASASDMKLHHNDNEHYSISIPSDWEYQDVNKIGNPNLQGQSLLAMPKPSGIFYIEKVQQVLFTPIEDWADSTRKDFFQGIKESKLSKIATFKGSGEIDINNNKFLWAKFSSTTHEILLYSVVRNRILYSIVYIYPINNREKILPKITESLNSLKFDDIQPNWYWVNSNERASTYIDTNSITSYKDLTTNTIRKMVTAKITSPSFSNEGFSNLKAIFEFKEENGVNYYRPLSMASYDDNDNLIKYIFNLINMKNDSSYDRYWNNVTTNKDMEKIADLLK